MRGTSKVASGECAFARPPAAAAAVRASSAQALCLGEVLLIFGAGRKVRRYGAQKKYCQRAWRRHFCVPGLRESLPKERIIKLTKVWLSTKSLYHADLVAAHIIARRWLFWQSDVNEEEEPRLFVDMRETMARHDGERCARQCTPPARSRRSPPASCVIRRTSTRAGWRGRAVPLAPREMRSWRRSRLCCCRAESHPGGASVPCSCACFSRSSR